MSTVQQQVWPFDNADDNSSSVVACCSFSFMFPQIETEEQSTRVDRSFVVVPVVSSSETTQYFSSSPSSSRRSCPHDRSFVTIGPSVVVAWRTRDTETPLFFVVRVSRKTRLTRKALSPLLVAPQALCSVTC